MSTSLTTVVKGKELIEGAQLGHSQDHATINTVPLSEFLVLLGEVILKLGVVIGDPLFSSS